MSDTSLVKWDRHFFELCETISRWSSCKSRKIGAVVVRDKTIVSTGYNGPPRGVPHCGDIGSYTEVAAQVYNVDPTPKCPRRALGYNSGEGLHLCPAAHAEANAIANAARIGVSTVRTTMYMNCGIPCRECMKLIINAGILELVCLDPEDWYDELSKFLVVNSDVRIRAFSHERNSNG